METNGITKIEMETMENIISQSQEVTEIKELLKEQNKLLIVQNKALTEIAQSIRLLRN